MLERVNLELNVIADLSEFKADAGGSTDKNSAWLAHTRIDHSLGNSWNLGLDLLGTSGSADTRVSGAQVVGHRNNFASPNPSASYLLTIATNDGGDDAAGSVRLKTPNQIARLDLDEGLHLAVISLSKSINDKLDGLVRVGQIKTGSENSGTNSSDYGKEVDLKLNYKSSVNTTWIFEAGIFNPGKYFVNQDSAKLTTLKYKLDF